MLRLRDIRFTDRKGELLPYRIVAPPVVDQRFRTALLPNYPNPFNSSTVLPFQISASAASTSLRIYDLLGQPVRTLLQGALQPGHHQVVWDGRDDRGHAVASGTYVSRLDVAPSHLTRKLLLLR